MRGYGSVRLRLVTVIAPQPTASQRLVMVGYGWLFLKNRITDHLNSILEIIVINSRIKGFINKQIRRTETCNICIFQSVSYSGSFQNGSRFPIAWTASAKMGIDYHRRFHHPHRATRLPSLVLLEAGAPPLSQNETDNNSKSKDMEKQNKARPQNWIDRDKHMCACSLVDLAMVTLPLTGKVNLHYSATVNRFQPVTRGWLWWHNHSRELVGY